MSDPMSEPAASTGAPVPTLPLPVLREQLVALTGALIDAQARAAQATLPVAERDALKDDIVALFRQADQAVQEAQRLKDEVKGLASLWKRLGTPRPAPPPRIDHLGASTFVEKGWSKLSLGEAAGAEEALRRALQLAPGNDEAETLLGWALMLQGKLADAAATLESVRQRIPGHALATATLGAVRLRQAAYDDAASLLDDAVRSERDRKAVLYAHLYRGQLYHALAQYPDAARCFRTALELGPNLLQAWYELGRTHWFAGEHIEALAAWRRGAEANKFSPWGKRCAETMSEVEQGGAPPREG